MFTTILSSSKDSSPYIQEEFSFPTGVAVDSNGTFIFADAQNGKIFKVSGSTGKIIPIAGSESLGHLDGKGLDAKFNWPLGVTIDGNDVIYVADNSNWAIRRISLDNIVTTVLSGNKVGPIKDITCFKAERTLYYVSGSYVFRVQSDGSDHRLWAGSSQSGYKDGKGSSARFNDPKGISVNQVTGEVMVTDYLNGAIRGIDVNQRVTTIVKKLKTPWGVSVIKNESIVFTELYGQVIKKFSLEHLNVTLVAGNGDAGIYDGLGASAVLAYPTYIEWNSRDDELIFSQWGSGIRTVNKFNYVTTFIMPLGYGNDDGPAHKARISGTIAIAPDENGDCVYFVDKTNNLIRKANLSNGTVTTIAGKLSPGNKVGNLRDSLFANPSGIAFYNDTLLIADGENDMIKKASLKDDRIDILLTMYIPKFISMDASKKSFYVFQSYNGSPIFQFSLEGELIRQLGKGTKGCDDGHYTTATFGIVEDVYSMANGRVYLNDVFCGTVRVFDPQTGNITVVAGNAKNFGYADGIGADASFSTIYGLDYFTPEKAFYISDGGSNFVRKMTLDGNVTTFAGSINGGYRNGPLERALFHYNSLIRVLSNGDILLCDDRNMALRIIKKDGNVGTLFGYGSQKYHTDPGSDVDLNYPVGITSKDQTIFVLNKEDNNLIGFDPRSGNRFLLTGNGAIGWIDGDTLKSSFNRPEDIHYVRSIDLLFVADTKNHLIRKVTLQGIVSTFAGTGDPGFKNDILLSSAFHHPTSIASDNDGNLFVTDSGNNVIRKIVPSTGLVSTFAGGFGTRYFVNGPLQNARFCLPTGISFNSKSGTFVIADMYNHAIRSMNSTHVDTMAGSGAPGFLDGPYAEALFSYPRKITVDQYGTIYVTDFMNDRIRRLEEGVVTTISKLENPLGLHFSNGMLYVSEYRNNLIKSLSVAKVVRTSTGSAGFDTIGIVAIATISIFAIGLGVIAFWWTHIRLKFKVTHKLKNLHISSPSQSSKPDQTGTKTLQQPLAIAIPGYLALDLYKSVKVEYVGGKGGTAKVFLGTLKDPKKVEKHGFVDVAVKFLNETAKIEELYYEITVMNALPKSDHIVELVGYSISPPAIVMKSYLSSLVDKEAKRFYAESFDTQLDIAMGIAKGMEIIHKFGIIHFDLKPANILLHHVSNRLCAAICDFGFANFTSDAKSNMVKGVKCPNINGITARYAAPEQFLKFMDHRLDDDIYKKVDVYAYGMTIYYLFTGSKPWQSEDNIAEIEKRVCNGERPDISEKVNLDIKILMTLCWSHIAKDRLSFTEILEKLNRISCALKTERVHKDL